MSVEEFLKNLVLGTPVEGIARKLYGGCWAFSGHRQRARVTAVEDLNQNYDQQTLSIMKKVLTDDSNCIDVGCHEGVILTEILKLASKGEHFAFEPISALCNELKQKFPNVHVYEVALSDSSGSSTFQHVVSNPGYSGLKKRRYDKPREVIREVTVQTEKLDDVIPVSTHVDFIKVDVEGAELQVFKGGVETIKRNRPVIVFEHGLGAADCYDTRPEDVYDLLNTTCCLKLSTLENWLNGRATLSRSEFARQFYEKVNFYFIAHP